MSRLNPDGEAVVRGIRNATRFQPGSTPQLLTWVSILCTYVPSSVSAAFYQGHDTGLRFVCRRGSNYTPIRLVWSIGP